MSNNNYVLLTSARNEEYYIKYSIDSVLAQTLLPKKWIIISDGSTDGTDDIILAYSKEHSFIEYLRIDQDARSADFASKVFALREGYKRLKGVDYNFLGNLDADISFGVDYYSKILSRFHENKKLGIAGGFIQDIGKDISRNTSRNVPGGIQLFRRDCYEAIGGLPLVPHGGEDWIAETMARMCGWEVQAFPECKVLHHKSSENSRGVWNERFRQGLMDYSVGSHPAFELIKCMVRGIEKPYFIGSVVRFSGFVWSYFLGKSRSVSPEFICYLRMEQLNRLRISLKTHNAL